MKILAIDPGTEKSAWCGYDRVSRSARTGLVMNNATLGYELRYRNLMPECDVLAIEMIDSYGMRVGRDVFRTLMWIGRFIELAYTGQAADRVVLVTRRAVKLHLCNSPRATDANIRRAVLDRFASTGGGSEPEIGTKDQPGPLYGIRASGSHIFAALAVAITWAETEEGEEVAAID